jgi:hypothetical protein
MISISNIPGGNPAALAEPEHFAIHYTKCSACPKLWCDRCAGARCSCGAAIRAETPNEKLAHFDLGSRAAIRIKNLVLPADPSGAPEPGGPRFLVATPSEKLSLVHRARELMFGGGGTPATILATLDRAIAIDPSFAEAYAVRGWVHVLTGSPEKAAIDLATALEKGGPSWPQRADVSADLATLR